MRILVCVKRVPAPGARINITADGQAIDTAYLGFTTSPHEECAVEEAMQLVEQHGGEATVLTLGPPRPRSSCATRPASALPTPCCCRSTVPIGIRNGRRQRSPRRSPTSRRPTAPFDLILFGNESADSRRLPGRRPRRPCARPPDRQRHQGIDVDGRHAARPPRGRRRLRGLRAAAAGGARRQGGHQPPPLPDAEGPAGVEEGRRSPRSTPTSEPGGQKMITLLPAAEQVSATVILGNRSGRCASRRRHARPRSGC